ncbi:MAG TPA: metallophosphoesterase family protein [Anaeromyxobacter sp.]
MRIGVASDSFGNVELLGTVLDRFVRARVDRVFFLGGRCADVDAALARRGAGATREAPVPRTDSEFLAAVQGALSRQAGPAKDPLAGRLVRVASRACPEYASGSVPKKQVDLVEGLICCLVHDKADLDRDDIANASVIFHGNSGNAALVQIGPRTFVTPGHLRAPAPAGRPGSYGLVEVTPKELVLTVFSEAGAELKRERASFAAGAKMSVR